MVLVLVLSLCGSAAVKGRVTDKRAATLAHHGQALPRALPASGQGCQSRTSLAARRQPSRGGLGHQQPATHSGSATAPLGWCQEQVWFLIP